MKLHTSWYEWCSAGCIAACAFVDSLAGSSPAPPALIPSRCSSLLPFAFAFRFTASAVRSVYTVLYAYTGQLYLYFTTTLQTEILNGRSMNDGCDSSTAVWKRNMGPKARQGALGSFMSSIACATASGLQNGTMPVELYSSSSRALPVPRRT